MKTTKGQNTEFGMMVTLVLLVISLWCKTDLYVFAVITLLISMLADRVFTPFAWLWFRLAGLLEQTISKVILFLVFFLVITPVGIIRQLAGKDPLQLKRFAGDKGSVFTEREHLYEKEDLDKQG